MTTTTATTAATTAPTTTATTAPTTTTATAPTTTATTAPVSALIPAAAPAGLRLAARPARRGMFRSLVLAGVSLASAAVGVVAAPGGAAPAGAAPVAPVAASTLPLPSVPPGAPTLNVAPGGLTVTAAPDAAAMTAAVPSGRAARAAFTGSGNLADATGVDRTIAMPKIRVAPGTESIVGADNRVQVANTTAYPYRATVLLYDTASGARCSGFMIGPSTVGTAAHCVFSDRTKAWWNMATLRAYPGYDGKGGQGPYGSCGVRNLMTNTTWTTSVKAGTPNWDHDYGAVALSCTVGNTTGWFGLSTGGTAAGATLRTAGFPGDKPYTMWTTTGSILQAFANQLYTNMDIKGGQSGSPCYRSLADGAYVSAIVSWESLVQSTYNGLNRITSAKIKLFNTWKTY